MYNRRESAGRRSRKVSTLQAIKTEKRKKAPIGIDYFLSVCYSTGGKPNSFKFYFIFRRLAVLFTSFSETGLSIGFHISCPCILTFDESSYWCTMTFIFDWFFPQWYLFRNCLVKKSTVGKTTGVPPPPYFLIELLSSAAIITFELFGSFFLWCFNI